MIKYGERKSITHEERLNDVPIKNASIKWYIKDDSKVIIQIYHNGIMNHIATKFFKAPDKTNLELDDIGSYVWVLIDGYNSVEDIGRNVSKTFNQKAEPLYERLNAFLDILRDQIYIS